ncbi:hypothetical protein NQ317_010758 [Molorchus minor]|uniref:Uncharacterized protein n=1 Tax=Molorchus minor TaxID=1323400 RepID=A0ABQ9IR39_9CUCU|nr:hypothetical protein NQ317_010758 [Molorchus minor]
MSCSILDNDTINPRVIPPKDLVTSYICGVNWNSRRRVERRTPSEDLEKCHIVRIPAPPSNLDCPLEVLQGTLFFRLMISPWL